MAKTSMTAVVDRIMSITERFIERDGRCTLEECRRGYDNLYGIQVGEDFVRNVWEQKGLEVVYLGSTGWVAENPPSAETGDDTDAPDA